MPISKCSTPKCPKKDLIEELERDKSRIIKASEKNKKYYRNVVKILAIACGVLISALILTLAFGKEGIRILIDLMR